MNPKKPLITVALLVCASLACAQQQDAGNPTTIRVPEPVMAGRLIHNATPGFPEELRHLEIKGAVVVTFHVDKQGNTVEPFAADGDPLLRDAAIDAVKQWQFEPYRLNDEPVEVETSATLRFPPVALKKIRVSQGVMTGSLSSKVNPVYRWRPRPRTSKATLSSR